MRSTSARRRRSGATCVATMKSSAEDTSRGGPDWSKRRAVGSAGRPRCSSAGSVGQNYADPRFSSLEALNRAFF